jgi:hypothetical protein
MRHANIIGGTFAVAVGSCLPVPGGRPNGRMTPGGDAAK